MPSGKLLKIVSAHIGDRERTSGTPVGTVVSVTDGISVLTSDGVIVLDTIVPEGKSRMSAADFVRGRGVSAGEILGAE
jgi:methionyl-tRNA formyltransferase